MNKVETNMDECVAAVNSIMWEFKRKFFQNGVHNVSVWPRCREYDGREFYTYDIYIRTEEKEMSRIRIAPNFKRRSVIVSIMNKDNLIQAIEEGKRLSA